MPLHSHPSPAYTHVCISTCIHAPAHTYMHTYVCEDEVCTCMHPEVYRFDILVYSTYTHESYNMQFCNTADIDASANCVHGIFSPIPIPKRPRGRPSNDSRKWGVLDFKQKSVRKGRPTGKRKARSGNSSSKSQKKNSIEVVHHYNALSQSRDDVFSSPYGGSHTHTRTRTRLHVICDHVQYIALP
jgi:hypothetical protein